MNLCMMHYLQMNDSLNWINRTYYHQQISSLSSSSNQSNHLEFYRLSRLGRVVKDLNEFQSSRPRLLYRLDVTRCPHQRTMVSSNQWLYSQSKWSTCLCIPICQPDIKNRWTLLHKLNYFNPFQFIAINILYYSIPNYLIGYFKWIIYYLALCQLNYYNSIILRG